jgi:hypothetical protein
MQLEQTFGCPWIMGFAGSWNEFWILKFSPCRFERIAAALRKVGLKVANSAALPARRHRRWAMVSAFRRSQILDALRS